MKNPSRLLTVLTVLTVATIFLPKTSAAFKDVPLQHPNRTAIDFVQSKGIVGGYPDGTYQPDRLLNRAEFTKIIIESRFKKTEIDNCTATEGFYKRKIFTDVENGVWFEKYICVAKRNNIIGGYPDGSFKPTQTINFAEAAKIVSNAHGFSVGTGASWFAPFIEKLASLNAIPVSITLLGSETERALKELSRGEMAEVIFRMKDEDNSVSSSDGNFSISIPETALPEGIKKEDIMIRKIETNEAPVREINGAPMLFYELEPDGIQFKTPVTFSISAATSKNTIPLVFLVSGDTFDLIPEPIVEIDQSTQTANISGQLAHFSSIAVGNLPLFSLMTQDVGNQKVGNIFPRTIAIEKNTTPNTFVNNIDTTSISVLADWSIGSGMFEATSGLIDPSLIVDVPNFHLLSGPQFYTVKEYFMCDSAGPASSKYHFTLDFTYIRKYGQISDIKSGRTVVSEEVKAFNCVP